MDISSSYEQPDFIWSKQWYQLMLCEQFWQPQSGGIIQCYFIYSCHGTNDHQFGARGGCGGEECEEGVEERVRDLDLVTHLNIFH